MQQGTRWRWTSLVASAATLLLGALHVRAQESDEGLIRMARVEDPHAVGVGRVLPDLDLVALRDQKHTLSELLKDRKAVVIAMTGATCPMSKDYTPRLAEMERDYARRGVAFVFVNSVEAETLGDMQEQVKRGRFEGPYIPDRNGAVRRALGVRTTTEAFLIDSSRTLVYRGAVDDQHGIGKSLPAPNNNYLADAMDSVLTGARPRIRATWAPGCLVSAGNGFAARPGSTTNTYTNRIAWLLAESCVSCHRPGGAAPFPLDSYEAVVGRAKMIEAVVASGLMPPWHGVAAPTDPDEPSPWVTDRSLTTSDRDALLGWLRSDKPRGEDGPLPVLPPLSRTWAIGEPDLLLTSSGLRLAAKGGMQHGRVMVGFPGGEDKWLSAIELRPVETGSIHHALVWVLAPGDVLPAVAEMPGSLELVATYSPGDNVLRYPAGTARRIRAGSIFLVDLYAKPMGKELISALRMGFKWGGQPRMSVRSITARATQFQPDPADDLLAVAQLAVSPGERVLAMTPYLRSRASSYAIAPAAPTNDPAILDAPHHDFRWVLRYELLEPRTFPGNGLTIRARYRPDAGDAPGPLELGAEPESEALLLSVEVLQPVPTPK